MGNYAVSDDIRNFKVKGRSVSLDTLSDGEISSEITLIEERIEDITEDVFYSYTGTKLFNGNGLTRLFLYPVTGHRLISVTSLKELDLDGTTVLDTFVENTDFKKYDYYVETARSFSGDRPRRRFGTGGTWPKGQKNIEIIGSWGRSAVPATIKRITILWALERLMPGSTQLQRGDIAQAIWPDFSVSYRNVQTTVDNGSGFPELDRMLNQYINRIGMMITTPIEKAPYDNPIMID